MESLYKGDMIGRRVEVTDGNFAGEKGKIVGLREETGPFQGILWRYQVQLDNPVLNAYVWLAPESLALGEYDQHTQWQREQRGSVTPRHQAAYPVLQQRIHNKRDDLRAELHNIQEEIATFIAQLSEDKFYPISRMRTLLDAIIRIDEMIHEIAILEATYSLVYGPDMADSEIKSKSSHTPSDKG